MKFLIFTFSLIFVVSALAGTFAPSSFRFEGYRERTVIGSKSIQIKASVAEGMGQLKTKSLFRAEVVIEEDGSVYRVSADEMLFKNDEIIASGNAVFSLEKGKKVKLSFNAAAPESRLFFDVKTGMVLSPAARLKLNGEYFGRGLVINLQTRKVLWIQNVSRGQKPLKTPLELNFE